MNWEIWGPPLVILAGGLFVGAFLAGRASRAGTSASTGEELRALYENLSDQIRELDADRDKMDGEAYRLRRDALINQAADALRQLEGEPAPSGPAPQPTASTSAPKLAPAQTSGQGVIWATVSLAFFVVLGVLLSQNSFQRGENDTMTGGISSGGSGGGQDTTSMVAALEAGRAERQAAARAALEVDPNDLEALNTLTYDALLYRELETAMGYMESARAINGQHPDVQIHLAILQSFVGMPDRSLQALEVAAQANAEPAKLRLWRGFLNGRVGNVAAAQADLEFAVRNAQWTEEQVLASGLLQELRTGPPAAPPMASSAPLQAPSGGAVHLRGQVTLADGVSAPPGYTLFFSVRSSPAGGPPAAAQKLTGVSFPLDVELGDAQLLPMSGGTWPEEVWVQARLDADGDAMTKGDTDLESEMMGPLTKGSEGLSFILR